MAGSDVGRTCRQGGKAASNELEDEPVDEWAGSREHRGSAMWLFAPEPKPPEE